MQGGRAHVTALRLVFDRAAWTPRSAQQAARRSRAWTVFSARNQSNRNNTSRMEREASLCVSCLEVDVLKSWGGATAIAQRRQRKHRYQQLPISNS